MLLRISTTFNGISYGIAFPPLVDFVEQNYTGLDADVNGWVYGWGVKKRAYLSALFLFLSPSQTKLQRNLPVASQA